MGGLAVRAARFLEGGPSRADPHVGGVAAGALRLRFIVIISSLIPRVGSYRGGELACADDPADGGSPGQGPVEVGSLMEQGDSISSVPSGAADRLVERSSIRLEGGPGAGNRGAPPKDVLRSAFPISAERAGTERTGSPIARGMPSKPVKVGECADEVKALSLGRILSVP